MKIILKTYSNLLFLSNFIQIYQNKYLLRSTCYKIFCSTQIPCFIMYIPIANRFMLLFHNAQILKTKIARNDFVCRNCSEVFWLSLIVTSWTRVISFMYTLLVQFFFSFYVIFSLIYPISCQQLLFVKLCGFIIYMIVLRSLILEISLEEYTNSLRCFLFGYWIKNFNFYYIVATERIVR